MREGTPTIPPTTNSKIWQAHLRALQKSGLTRAEYCRQHNLSYHALTYWKKKADLQKKAATHFVSVPAVRIKQGVNNHTAALKIDLDARLKIEVYDGFTPATLSRIISTLQGC